MKNLRIWNTHEQKFQNRIPTELDESFEISRIGMIHWISSNFLKKSLTVKKICQKLFRNTTFLVEPIHQLRNISFLGGSVSITPTNTYQ